MTLLRTLTLCLMLSASLTACDKHGNIPGISVDGDGYRIDVDGDHGHKSHGKYKHKKKHCPPGHAKKGWC